jgi:hypothetical protein
MLDGLGDVATRWLTLFPLHRDMSGAPIPPAEVDIRLTASFVL